MAAGRWLAAHAGPGDAIIDPFDWAQFYAGRTLYEIPPDPPNPPAIYAVLDNADDRTPNSLLPRYEYATRLARQGQIVFRWPEAGTPRVFVYRVGAGDR